MKAIRLHEFGGPEVLRVDEVPRPKPKAGEVLVRVRAVGVNPPDWYLRSGYEDLPEFKPPVSLPAIPGSDVSGEVVGTGDEVFGMIKFPSFGDSAAYAEYVAAPASDLAPKPKRIDHIQAAAAPMSALTAWQYLIELGHDAPNPFQSFAHRPMALDASTTVLVNGAAGGVGHFAVQLAKWKGARVIAVASGKHEAFLRELGADEFVDYKKTKPEHVVRDVDLVLDTLGGPTSGRFLRTLKRGGALYPVFLTKVDPADLERAGVTMSMTQVRSNGRQLAEIARLFDEGKLRVAIDSTFALEDARKAHERARDGHIQGKIALTVSEATS